MTSDFWARKLGGARPAPAAPAPVPQGSAWWQTPASVPVQQPAIPQPALAPRDSVEQLQNIPADQLSQDQMEQLAESKLQQAKYNTGCPQCSSTNYAPQGTKMASGRMTSGHCFECGYSDSSSPAQSPDMQPGGKGKSGSPARQTADGGAVRKAIQREGLPAQYIPRA